MKKLALLILRWSAFAPRGAQVAGQANQHYQTKEQREDIARGLMSPGAKSRHPETLIATMQLKTGMTVADIGTGAGFHAAVFEQGRWTRRTCARRRYPLRFS